MPSEARTARASWPRSADLLEPRAARRSGLLFFSILAVLLSFAAPLSAQDPLAAVVEGDSVPECGNGRISYIFIDNHSIFDTSDPELDDRFDWAYGIANALHVRTRASVIRRELLFGIGDCYQPLLLEETERLLRGYRFLSRVDVFGVHQPDSTVHVIVDTTDEWSTQVDLRLGFEGGIGIEGLNVRETNLLGTGQTLGVFYIQRDVTRDYGVRYETPQFMGTRWDLRSEVGRTRAGTLVRQSIAYPFVGEVSHFAARQGFAREDRFFDYIASPQGGGTRVLIPVRAKSFDVGVVRRFGDPGRLTVIGGALGYQGLLYPGFAEVSSGDDFGERQTADSTYANAVRQQMEEVNNIRVFLLLGQRHIYWVRRRGFDSLRGVQDVPLGSEIEIALGRTLSALQRRDDDLFATFTLNTGFEIGNVLTAIRLRGDARRDFEAPADESEWQDVLTEGELLTYWQPGSRHTLLFRGAAAGGWHTRTPFQLTLGGERGVRGYDRVDFPGGRRLLMTVEDRIYFGWPLPDVLDIGGTLFFDAGYIWPGDVPFGTQSGIRTAAGFGLRGSLPAGGRTTYRLDVAFPLRGPGHSPRFLFSIGEVLGLSDMFGDSQVERSRAGAVTGSLYTSR